MEFPTREVALSLIRQFRLQDFDQIRTSGGSSYDEEYYSAVFIAQYDKESKQVFFLGLPYNSSFYKENESNGHTKKNGESPTETAIREGIEETGLLIKECDLKLVYHSFVPNRKDITKNHHKYFYLVDNFQGTLFDFLDEPNPIDNETSTPIWIPASLFREVLFEGHQKSLRKAIEELKQTSVEYYYALESV